MNLIAAIDLGGNPLGHTALESYFLLVLLSISVLFERLIFETTMYKSKNMVILILQKKYKANNVEADCVAT